METKPVNAANDSALLSVADGVATLRMNRGAQRNTLHPTLIAALSTTLGELAVREDVAVVVLTGTGPVFSAGLDLAHLGTLTSDERVRYMRSAFSFFMQLHQMPQPTIAAVNGPAIAGGFDLAVFCDLRIGVPGSRFGQPEVLLGVTQFLYPAYTLIGLGRALELALTGEAIDAQEAYRIGLLNHLVSESELMPKALALAEKLVQQPRGALFATKRLGRELPGLEAAAAFTLIGDALERSLGSQEHLDALSGYLAAKTARS